MQDGHDQCEDGLRRRSSGDASAVADDIVGARATTRRLVAHVMHKRCKVVAIRHEPVTEALCRTNAGQADPRAPPR